MTTNNYMDHLRQRLRAIERDMAQARKKVETGPAQENASALSELSKLEIKHKDIEERLEAAAAKHAEDWSAVKAGFQEDIDGLSDTLENWITKSI